MSEFEPASDGRLYVELIDGTPFLVARTKRNWVLIFLLFAGMVQWAGSLPTAVERFLEIPLSHWPYLFGLVMWAVLGFFVFSWLFWEIGGRMEVGVENRTLIYRWSMFPFSRVKRYETRWIRNVRGVVPLKRRFFKRFSYYGCPPFFYFNEAGSVGFDYFVETVTIMPGLDRSESGVVSLWIERRLAAEAETAA